MADLTSTIKKPGAVAAAPVYTAVTATDSFQAKAGSKYRLHYKNGATPGTGVLKVTDPTTQQPAGSTAAAGFADLQISAAMGATSELVAVIQGGRHVDPNGLINLAHAGTLTTITVAIEEQTS
jgi:hypothetical protein